MNPDQLTDAELIEAIYKMLSILIYRRARGNRAGKGRELKKRPRKIGQRSPPR